MPGQDERSRKDRSEWASNAGKEQDEAVVLLHGSQKLLLPSVLEPLGHSSGGQGQPGFAGSSSQSWLFCCSRVFAVQCSFSALSLPRIDSAGGGCCPN